MKLETGYKQITTGIPAELETAAKALARSCHTVNFLKTDSGIFYAIGELSSQSLSDIYLRYEEKFIPEFFDGLNPSKCRKERIIVTITCYGIVWLPLLGKPQLCVYERKVNNNIHIVVAECWAAILGAIAMFPMIDFGPGFNLGPGFNRIMAGKLVEDTKDVMPAKVYNKLREKFALEELPGRPPISKIDVLARFVGYTQPYVLSRIASAHKAFYYSLFKSSEAIVTIEKPVLEFIPIGSSISEPTPIKSKSVLQQEADDMIENVIAKRFPSKEIIGVINWGDKWIKDENFKHETRTVEETSETAPLDGGDDKIPTEDSP